MRTSVGFALTLVLVAGGLASTVSAASAGEEASCRTIPVDADSPLHADVARDKFGVYGSGVKVGVLSDSFALTAAAGANVSDDIANGLLPGPGNPCGYNTPVNVLREGASGNDEGRAMVQLVHGIAPGAAVTFVSTDETRPASLVEGIDMLIDAGVDIIVDDVEPKSEPVFQRSLAGEAIMRATDAGIAYFSAAGNGTMTAASPLPGQQATPINGWETTAYRPMPCPADVADAVVAQGHASPVDCLDVNPGESTDPTLAYGVGISPESELDFQWGEPLGRVSGLFVPVVKINGAPVATAPIPMQDGTPGFSVALPASDVEVAVTVSVARVAVPDAGTSLPLPPIYVAFNQHNYLFAARYPQSAGDDIVGRTIVGHNGDPAAISVAAAPYTDPLTVEGFSSYGPVTWAFGSSLAAEPSQILEPRPVMTRPDILSVDKVRNSVLGTETTDDTGKIFGGTSAAAPNAAAVGALILSYAPDTNPEQLRDLLGSTATPAASPWSFVTPANAVGAGLINADAALTALPTPAPTPTPQPTQTVTPTPTAAPTTPAPAPNEAGPARLANSGMDTSTTPLLLLGALTLLIVGGAVSLSIRSRKHRHH